MLKTINLQRLCLRIESKVNISAHLNHKYCVNLNRRTGYNQWRAEEVHKRQSNRWIQHTANRKMEWKEHQYKWISPECSQSIRMKISWFSRPMAEKSVPKRCSQQYPLPLSLTVRSLPKCPINPLRNKYKIQAYKLDYPKSISRKQALLQFQALPLLAPTIETKAKRKRKPQKSENLEIQEWAINSRTRNQVIIIITTIKNQKNQFKHKKEEME